MSARDSKYAVLFDIDGTLLMTGGAGKRCFVETFRDEFQIAEPSGDVPFAGRSDRAIALELMRVNGIDPSVKNWRQFHDGYCRRIESTIADCQGYVLPGVEALLDAIAKLPHVVLGLLTGNVEHGAQAKLAHYGLDNWFAFGGFGEQYTDRNDIAAAAQRAAIQHLASEANNEGPSLRGTMVIGDTVSDINCARSIGAFAVAVATGGASTVELAPCAPDLLLDDLTDTEALLEALHTVQVC